MANYYLDIETTGLNPQTSKILTIQFWQLDPFTGKPYGELTILKSWESSEKEILQKFIELTNICSDSIWDFVPHGYNLKFEHNFLKEKSKLHYLPEINILNRPHLDLHPVGIMMNGGNFKGSGLDKISGKQKDGLYVIECYTFNDYEKIEEYIKQEAEEYIKLYSYLKKKMPEVLEEFRRD